MYTPRKRSRRTCRPVNRQLPTPESIGRRNIVKKRKVTFGDISDKPISFHIANPDPKSILKSAKTVEEAEDGGILDAIYSGAISEDRLMELGGNIVKEVYEVMISDEEYDKLSVYASLNAVVKCDESSIFHAEDVNVIMEHSMKDLTAAESSVDPLDIRIVLLIIKVVTNLFGIESIAENIADSSKQWYFERAMIAIENNTSKTTIGAYLHFINHNKIVPSLLSQSKNAIRLLDAIVNAPCYSSGGTVSEYLLSLQILFVHAPRIMISNLHKWLRIPLSRLHTGPALVRSRALSVLQQAVAKFGTDANMGNVASGYFSEKIARDGRTSNFDRAMDSLQQLVLSSPTESRHALNVCSILAHLLSVKADIANSPYFERIAQFYLWCASSSEEAVCITALESWRSILCIFKDKYYTSHATSRLPPSSKVSELMLLPLNAVGDRVAASSNISLETGKTLDVALYCFMSPPLIIQQASAALYWSWIWKTTLEPMLRSLVEMGFAEFVIIMIEKITSSATLSSSIIKSNTPLSDQTLLQGGIAKPDFPIFPLKYLKLCTFDIAFYLIKSYNPKSKESNSIIKAMWQKFLGTVRPTVHLDPKQGFETMSQIASIGKLVNQNFEEESQLSCLRIILNVSYESLGYKACTASKLTVDSKSGELTPVQRLNNDGRGFSISLFEYIWREMCGKLPDCGNISLCEDILVLWMQRMNDVNELLTTATSLALHVKCDEHCKLLLSNFEKGCSNIIKKNQCKLEDMSLDAECSNKLKMLAERFLVKETNFYYFEQTCLIAGKIGEVEAEREFEHDDDNGNQCTVREDSMNTTCQDDIIDKNVSSGEQPNKTVIISSVQSTKRSVPDDAEDSPSVEKVRLICGLSSGPSSTASTSKLDENQQGNDQGGLDTNGVTDTSSLRSPTNQKIENDNKPLEHYSDNCEIDAKKFSCETELELSDAGLQSCETLETSNNERQADNDQMLDRPDAGDDNFCDSDTLKSRPEEDISLLLVSANSENEHTRSGSPDIFIDSRNVSPKDTAPLLDFTGSVSGRNINDEAEDHSVSPERKTQFLRDTLSPVKRTSQYHDSVQSSPLGTLTAAVHEDSQNILERNGQFLWEMHSLPPPPSLLSPTSKPIGKFTASPSRKTESFPSRSPSREYNTSSPKAASQCSSFYDDIVRTLLRTSTSDLDSLDVEQLFELETRLMAALPRIRKRQLALRKSKS